MTQDFDLVVIGSGIGGLGAAAALANLGKRVLVLERHWQPGGLTQTFERAGFQFNVGVHYLGGFGPGQSNRRIFDLLAGGRIAMAPIAGVYDRVFFPDFNLPFTPPCSELQRALKGAFPAETAGIDRYFECLDAASNALGALFMTHSAPALIAKPLAFIERRAIARWVERTTWDVVRECTNDPRLQAVLCAQWGDYGSRPLEGSFAAHAQVMSHYLDGAWYPVGGSASFARELGRTIEAAGGEVRTNAEVVGIDVDTGAVRGLRLREGRPMSVRCVISDTGAHNTLRLLPSAEIDYSWAQDALSIEPSLGFVGLYVGLEGDIAALGADTANTWLYESWDVNRLWRDPFTEATAPALFVSFPSLRDPAHAPGSQQRHTCEVVALVDWSVFGQWDRSDDDGGMKRGSVAAVRSEGYLAFKDLLQRNLLAQFGRHFPKLAPLVRVAELSTPLSVATFTGAEHGAMYGLATTPARFLSQALRPRTPVRGLYLAGQDACMPGVTGALMGGLMAAASVDARVWKLLR
ncbi:MAG: NAD(P)/FAD-dependent oxidoreductase [Burkholderiales bacterium]|nr:NAD(P)/FAD-dependent oxidoreductase [Burkholderiales bacterium]